MSTITREQAQKIIEAADEVITALAGTNEDVHPESDNMLRLWDELNDRYAPPEVVRELARIALASLEAEPVEWRVAFRLDGQSGSDFEKTFEDQAKMNEIISLHERAGFSTSITPLFTAPPAPVSVPDELTREEYKRRFMEEDNFDDTFRGGWNACRAAMLQGAEPVTTAYKLPFEQWLSQQTGTIDVECGCVMTEVFFHWLRVAYEAGNSPVIPDGLRLALSNAGIAAPESDEMLAATCEKHIQALVTWVKERKPFRSAVIPDGWVMVPVEPTYQMCEAMGLPWESSRFHDRYKAMIAAAPQQEVK